MKKPHGTTRRDTLKQMGSLGALSLLSPLEPGGTAADERPPTRNTSRDFRQELGNRVAAEPFIDTHEHLIEEKGRLSGHAHQHVPADDWSMLLSHYLNSDLITSGMPRAAYDAFFSPETDPLEKWRLLAPYWPHVRHTGYGQATEIAMRALYEVDRLSADTVAAVQNGYDKTRKPGFYRHILTNVARIESCQVNSLEGVPFMETADPPFLMQDLNIGSLFGWIDLEGFSKPAGIRVTSLDDWYGVIDWWFRTYGPYAVAVKSAHAYSRDIDYERIGESQARRPFAMLLNGETLSQAERKALEDHLFWVAVDQATEYGLPVKLHTGYYAGSDDMPLGRLLHNPGSATRLCQLAPETTFVFMHIAYPYYEEILAAAKQHTNAYLDMCWAWIINPIAAKDFLKKLLVTVPSNKVLPFGGDYIPVEPVVGHAAIARRGITLALSELVDEGWLHPDEALELVPRIMHGNARTLFRLPEKQAALEHVPW